jgi:hypothetical protein
MKKKNGFRNETKKEAQEWLRFIRQAENARIKKWRNEGTPGHAR